MDFNKFRIGIMTDFSIGQSLLTTEKLVESAKAIGLEKIVVADDMTISSLIQLQRAAKAEGIDAMIGVKFRCYQDPTAKKKAGEKYENPYVAFKIFAKDEEGQKTIYKILTRANSEERYYYNARGAFEDLKELRNCSVTFGDLFGVTSADDLKRIELDPSCSLYAEFCPINTPYWDRVNMERVKALADERVKASIVSYPAMYATLEEADSMTPLKAVCTNTNIKSPFLPHQYVRDFAIERAPTIPQDFQSMLERIFERWPILKCALGLEKTNGACEAEEFHAEPYFKFEKHTPCLPQMAEDAFAEVVRQCKEGWKTRMFTKRLGYCPDASLLPKYKDRLAYELGIIKKMGFSNYFLVVADLVNWSKNNGVRVGCGRGSAGGSLIAYLMGITEVDPIRFNLIFERFINPSRQDLPDVDLDYQSSKRYKVIEYLTAKYGVDRVSGISNYGTLASASAFRDTGRIFGLSPNDMAATKLVPKENGISATLTEAADAVPEIDKLKDTYPDVWKHALRFEGVMRSLGQHAAGTVVAGEPLVNRAVVERRAEGNVVNWDKRVVEDYGLIKMDILGLSTLDVLDIAQQFIEKNHGVKVNYLDLPLDDPKVLDAFTNGDTTAVFQFDSKGMQGLLKRLGRGGRLSYDDITAATALYRPGPLDSGLTEEYVQIKQGLKSPHYDHPSMKPALQSTYGVMVYQEQIMQVSRDLAGFSMVEADNLRKATAKKSLEKMKKMEDKFINGAVTGFVEVTLDDGRTVRVHRATKFAVEENDQTWTVEEIFNNNFNVKGL
nr:MAG TPA: DNA polymerase III, alpha subunit [Caudoviricetes sp.]